MEEGERIQNKKSLQQEIALLSSMIREREMKLQTMNELGNNLNALQKSASPLEKNSTKNIGDASALNKNSNNSSVKCPSYSVLKAMSSSETVILENSKSQTSFKTTKHVILNSKIPTESLHPASMNKTASRANNIFINPNFKNSTIFNRLPVETPNTESQRDSNDFHTEKPSTSTLCNTTKNGIHVNPYFRNHMTKKTSESDQSYESEVTNIKSYDCKNISNVTVPNTLKHSDHPISSDSRRESVCIKDKPRTLFVNPKLIKDEPLNLSTSFPKLCGSNIESKTSELLTVHPTGKQPLTSRNSQDFGYLNRIVMFPNQKSNVENCEINIGKSLVTNVVRNNNFQPSGSMKKIMDQNLMGSSSSNSELPKFTSNMKKAGINYKLINSKLTPSLEDRSFCENSFKNIVPYKNRNILTNRGRKYAWSSTSNKINHPISEVPYNQYKFSKVPPLIRKNHMKIENWSPQRNKCWKKPPALHSSKEILNRAASSSLIQTLSSQEGSLSLNCQESAPSTSKTALVAICSTNVIRASRQSSKEITFPDPGANPITTDSEKKFLPIMNKSNAFSPKTTLIAVSRTKVIRKHKVSPKFQSQDVNHQETVINRKSLNPIQHRANKYYYTNSVSKADLLRMKYKTCRNFNILNKHRTSNQHSFGQNISLKQSYVCQRANVVSRLKFVSNKAMNTKGTLQNSSHLVSLSRNKLIREQSSSTKSVQRKGQTMTQFAAKNSRLLNKFNNPLYLAMNRNRYSLIRDRLRMRRQIHPYFQSADQIRMKYRHFNAANRRHLMTRKQIPQRRGHEFERPVRKRMKSVTIEGIKYHSSRLKLQRKPSISKDMKINDKQLVSVRGEKFEVGNGGRTLRRIGEGPVRLNKVYLGGIAFTRSKENDSTMLRTNTHNVRQLLRQAKQRSIAQLTKKMRKINEPCPIYHRFGKCSGKEKGTCNRVHDKKHISVCRRFLRGECDKKNCLLSHDVGLTNMPTCRHFLAGVCTRENCPYLHVKLNNSAPICLKFLQGYCPQAEKCKNRHIEICPEYEETSKCSKGKCCPYPHPKHYSRSNFIKGEDEKSTEIGLSDRKDEVLSDASIVANRYYMAFSDGKKMAEVTSIAGDLAAVEVKDSGTSWLKSRPKIGQLEGFIPFEEKK